MESSVPRWYERKPLHLVECAQCRLVYASSRPTRESMYATYLAGAAQASSMLEKKLARPNVLAVHRRHVQAAIRAHGSTPHHSHSIPKRIYDMGCGAGTILLAARELGLSGYGNDVNKACTDWLTAQGFQVAHGFTSDLPLPEHRMDIVANLDYIEHTYAPLEDLKRCYDMLNPGGILYLKTLYLDCPDHKAKGDGWQLFGVGHVYYYYADVLRDAIASAGFTIVDLKTDNLLTIVARRPLS